MKRVILMTIGSVLLFPSQAQLRNKKYTNFNDSIFPINEVVVTTSYRRKTDALRLDVPTKSIPISTNSITSGMLEKRNIRGIQETARFLPGVRFRISYGVSTQFSIRGFDNSVIMVDGAHDERSSIDNSYPSMDLSSVESIELLKGPTSVLYGQSAVGDILDIVHKAPVSKQSVYTRLAYGSYYNKQATMTLGDKLVGPLNCRASVSWQDQEGWENNVTKRLSGYLSLGGHLAENDKLDIRTGANHSFYPTGIGLPPTMSYGILSTTGGNTYLSKGDTLPGLNKKARYSNRSDFIYNRGLSVSAVYKHTFSETFESTDKLPYTYDNVDYFDTESLDYLASDGPIYDHYYITRDRQGNNTKRYICLDSIYYSCPLRFSHIAKTANSQLEASGKFYTGDAVRNYLGGYFLVSLIRDSYMAYGDGSARVTGPGTTGHSSVYNPHNIGWMEAPFRFVTTQKTFTHGFYLQDLVEFSDKLKMMLAGHCDLFMYKTANLNTNDEGRHCDKPDNNAYDEITNGAFTFRAGLVYLPIDKMSIYGSYGTYFGPIRAFYDASTIYINKDGKEFIPINSEGVFKPEKGFQVEAGARYEITRTLQTNVNLFYISKDNTHQTLTDKGNIANGIKLDKKVIGQVDRMDSKGFDISITWSPIYNLSISTGCGYTDAKVRDLANNPYVQTSTSEGKQYAYISKNTFYAFGAYTVSKGILKSLGVNLSTSFQDKVYRNSDDTSSFDAYWLTDLGLSYTLKSNVRLGVNVNNLFDKEYCNQALGNQLIPSMPHNFVLSASYTLQ